MEIVECASHKERVVDEKREIIAAGDANSIDKRNASVQPGDALETELERTRRVIVVDDVADGL